MWAHFVPNFGHVPYLGHVFWKQKYNTIEARYIAVLYNTEGGGGGGGHSTAITMTQLRSDFALTNDTPYLALTGELWDVFHKLLK